MVYALLFNILYCEMKCTYKYIKYNNYKNTYILLYNYYKYKFIYINIFINTYLYLYKIRKFI